MHKELADRDRASFGPRNTKPPGSIAWCWQTLSLLKSRWHRKDFTEREFAETLDEIRQQSVWEKVPPEQPYGSFDVMLQAELGETLNTANAKLLRAHDRTIAAAEQTTGEVLPAHRPKDEVGKFPTSQGARAALNGISDRTQRKLDHLAHKHPTLYASVVAGELSAHAAAKAAGIVKDSSPLTQLRRLWKKATPDERTAFLADILEDSPHA